MKCGAGDVVAVARRTGRLPVRSASRSRAEVLEAHAAVLELAAATDPAAVLASRYAAEARALAALDRRATPDQPADQLAAEAAEDVPFVMFTPPLVEVVDEDVDDWSYA